MNELKEEKDTGWFKVYRDFVDEGYMSEIGFAATCIYMAILRHADIYNGKAYPSIECIAEETGADRRTVMRRIKRLEYWGLISMYKTHNKRRGGKWKHYEYQVNDKDDWVKMNSENRLRARDVYKL